MMSPGGGLDCWEQRSDVESSVAGVGGDEKTRFDAFTHKVADYLVSFAIDLAGPPGMAVEMSIDDESQQRGLQCGRRLPIDQRAQIDRMTHQRLWKHDEPEPKRRRKRLREGPDVDHATVDIQTMKWFEWAIRMAVFVVVFDDGDVVVLGEVQQLTAPRHAHGHARRRLMRGSRVHHACFGRNLRDNDAVGVDWHWHDLGPGCRKEPCGRRIPTVFDRNNLARSDKETSDEIDALLGASGDDDLIGSCFDGARSADPMGDGSAERRSSSRVAVAAGSGLHGCGHAAPPLHERNERWVGSPGPEVEGGREVIALDSERSQFTYDINLSLNGPAKLVGPILRPILRRNSSFDQAF